MTFAFCRIRPIYWADVWWHLGVGEYITTHHHIPTVDIFSWTVRGASWINTEWLYEVVLYGFAHVMGLAGISFLKTAFMLMALYFLDRRLRLWKASTLERLFFMGLAFVGAWPFWVERTDLCSLALLSALFFELDRDRSESNSRQKNRLGWIVLFAMWPNLHGAYFIGLFIAGLHSVLLLFERPAAGRRSLLWVLCCAAATLANPYGIGLPLDIWRVMTSHFDHVFEWLPAAGWGLIFFFGALVLSVLSLLLPKKRTLDDFYDVAIVILFGGYALRHERFVHFFMIGAFPYAARQWLKSRPRALLASQLGKWERSALAVSALLLTLTSVLSARSIRGGISVLASGYAQGACDFIESQKIQGPFYNDYKLGSYWIWRFKGTPPVYQDGRQATIAGYNRVIEDTLQAQRSPETWNEFVDKRGIQAALVRYPAPLPGVRPSVFDRYFPRSSWGLVYWDDLGLIFVRRLARNTKLLARWEYHVIKPDWTLESYQDQLHRRLIDRRALRRELTRNLALNPGCWRAQVDLHWLDAAQKGNGS